MTGSWKSKTLLRVYRGKCLASLGWVSNELRSRTRWYDRAKGGRRWRRGYDWWHCSKEPFLCMHYLLVNLTASLISAPVFWIASACYPLTPDVEVSNEARKWSFASVLGPPQLGTGRQLWVAVPFRGYVRPCYSINNEALRYLGHTSAIEEGRMLEVVEPQVCNL